MAVRWRIPAVLETVESDEIDEGLRPSLAFLARKAHPLQAVEDIGADRLPRKQREVLKHDPAIGPWGADRLTLDEDLAGLRGEKAADEIEQRRLAAAGRSEQRNEFTRAHIERDVLEREHRPAGRRAIAMAHAIDDDLRLHHGPQPFPGLPRLRQASQIPQARQSPRPRPPKWIDACLRAQALHEAAPGSCGALIFSLATLRRRALRCGSSG
jgi:hypothetical protein